MTATAPGAGMVGDPGLAGAFRIDREGTWYHEDVEVTHPGVLRNLYANLRTDGEAHHLQVGPLRVPVEVADAPFVVVRAEVDREAGTVSVLLTDGSRELLQPETLLLDGRGIPYCRVKDGRYRARLSLSSWLQLAAAVEVDGRSGETILVLRDRRFVLRGAEDPEAERPT